MYRAIVAASLFVILGACSGHGQSQGTQTAQTTPAYDPAKFEDELKQRLGECSRKTGYNPDTSDSVPQNQIAPGELAWHQCAYQGIEDIVLPQTENPDLWRQLITEDEAMTKQIEAGTLTRSDRRARIDQLIEKIRAAEATTVAKAQPAVQQEELEEKTAFVRRMVNDFR